MNTKKLFSIGALLLMSQLLFAQFPGAGNALNFDGIETRVIIPDHSDLQPNKELTLEAWIKPNLDGNYRIISKWDGSSATGNDQGGFVFDTYDGIAGSGGLRFKIWDSTDVCFISPETGKILSIGEWQHAAAVFNNGDISIYLNGEMVSQFQFSQDFIIDTDFSWGIGEDADFPGANEHFNGSMDEIRIWNRALTQTELRDQMCIKIKPNHLHYGNLMAYYNFDQAPSQLLEDKKGIHAGEIVGIPEFTISAAIIGDFQEYRLNTITGENLIINHPDGDQFQATITQGKANSFYLIAVNETPNTNTPPSGVEKISDQRYWIAKAFGATNFSTDLKYDYEGHPLIDNAENFSLAYRLQNDSLNWDTIQNINHNGNEKSLFINNQTGGEYILSYQEKVVPPPPPSSFTTKIQFIHSAPIETVNLSLDGIEIHPYFACNTATPYIELVVNPSAELTLTPVNPWSNAPAVTLALSFTPGKDHVVIIHGTFDPNDAYPLDVSVSNKGQDLSASNETGFLFCQSNPAFPIMDFEVDGNTLNADLNYKDFSSEYSFSNNGNYEVNFIDATNDDLINEYDVDLSWWKGKTAVLFNTLNTTTNGNQAWIALSNGGTYPLWPKISNSNFTQYSTSTPVRPNEVTLFPNPASQFLQLNFNQVIEGQYQVSIFNTAGQILRELKGEALEGRNQLEINTAELPNGIYYCRLNQKESLSTMKFIIEQ